MRKMDGNYGLVIQVVERSQGEGEKRFTKLIKSFYIHVENCCEGGTGKTQPIYCSGYLGNSVGYIDDDDDEV